MDLSRFPVDKSDHSVKEIRAAVGKKLGRAAEYAKRKNSLKQF